MSIPSWRLLRTGHAPGSYNMALDEAIMTLYHHGHSLPTLRFFGWRPSCLSVGYFQSVERDINLTGCRKAGIDLVRRPTGGRAILHDAELTYSLIIAQENPLASGNVLESYRKISRGLMAGLRHLGVEAEASKEPSPGDFSIRTGACFASTSPYEITVEGKKLIGSAQLRREGVILQHGSILLESDGGKLFSLLKPRNGSSSWEAIEKFNQHVSSLNEVMKRQVTFQEVARAMKVGFEEALGVSLVEEGLSLEERLLTERLSAEKYGTEDWNLNRRTP